MRNGAPPQSRPAAGRSGRRTLTREDWARAALEALRESGLSAIAVEPLAEVLGTTKGSFYWHFKDRDSLIAAALELWAAETETLIADAEAIADPVERGRRVAEFAFATHSGGDITTTLLCHAQHPVVAPYLDRVVRARVDFGARLNEQRGMDPELARRHALMAYSMAVGITLVRRGAPQLMPQGEERDLYFAEILDLLSPPLPPAGD